MGTVSALPYYCRLGILPLKNFRQALSAGWQTFNAQKLILHYTYNVNRCQVVKIKRAKIKNAKINLSEIVPIYGI